jgi:hypothetical protein
MTPVLWVSKIGKKGHLLLWTLQEYLMLKVITSFIKEPNMPIRLTQVGNSGYDPAHVRLPSNFVGVQTRSRVCPR